MPLHDIFYYIILFIIFHFFPLIIIRNIVYYRRKYNAILGFSAANEVIFYRPKIHRRPVQT